MTMKVEADHGYVRLADSMGDELSIVNAARVSFDKESEELNNKDIGLLKFLVKHKHDSVLRHNFMTFEVLAPLLVARQWYKHAVASTHLDDQMGWNESSRRYITENNSYFIPHFDEWRYAPEDLKQGSSSEPIDKDLGVMLTTLMQRHVEKCEEIYVEAIARGVAPEQARLFLPAYALNVRWRWSASLNAVLNFLSLRTAPDSQAEIRRYAFQVETIVKEKYPNVYAAWVDRESVVE